MPVHIIYLYQETTKQQMTIFLNFALGHLSEEEIFDVQRIENESQERGQEEVDKSQEDIANANQGNKVNALCMLHISILQICNESIDNIFFTFPHNMKFKNLFINCAHRGLPHSKIFWGLTVFGLCSSAQ